MTGAETTMLRARNPIDVSLYLVLDPELCGGEAGMVATAQAAAAAGATVVQLRAPQWKKGQWLRCAQALQAVLQPLGVPLIINDHADVALAVDAAGVHVGQSDLPVAAVRALLGPHKIVGLSTNNLDNVAALLTPEVAACIDYIGVGPVYPTTTKLDASPVIAPAEMQAMFAACPMPAVAIGGIKAGRVAPLLAAGADGVAVISAICGQPDVTQATHTLLAEMNAARAERSGN
ncbi:thiamine phosphate synthase [Chitinibacter tainanensis]|uniref:thiamine phosphate synthase n=1 Tax=Chitinibacter tainanensis TaxID=230667 RepID=UPI00042725A9|nr:thiamine phosphate synthase [Chitinibacter tainanensis]